VSHIPERKEKDCLNCGANLQGRYCHVCGQENVVPHETFFHMAKHFFYDITHFDSKFFDTLKDLLFRPGFLSREYVKGRRASYLHPVKMYVFTSAIFFLVFFSFNKPGSRGLKLTITDTINTKDRRQYIIDTENEALQDSSQVVKDRLKMLKDSTRPVNVDDYINAGGKVSILNITGASKKFSNTHEYDSSQKALPKKERDRFFLQLIKKKEIALNEKYGRNPEDAWKELVNGLLHKLPYLLFVSLPLFALFLKLLYVRRKEFYYFDHGIFTIHHYIFCFILLLVVFALQGLSDWLGWGFFDIAAVILFFSGGFYLYKAMRNFYRQRRAKTIIKFLLLNLLGFISLVLLFVIFVFLSVFEL
jgi:hypothetical protein